MKNRKKVFSESVKRDNVRQIELGQKTQSEVAKLYGISPPAVSGWVRKYGKLPRRERVVIESESDYTALKEKEKELLKYEQTVGRLHMELTYLKQVIRQASIEYSEDIEKKFGKQ